MRAKGYSFIVPLFFVNVVTSQMVYDEDLYQSVLDADQCERQLNILTNNSLLYRFLDASATLPTGILTGNLNDLGNYHQCLGIDVLAEDTNIVGKYCTIIVPLSSDAISIPSVPEIPDFTWPPGVTWRPGATVAPDAETEVPDTETDGAGNETGGQNEGTGGEDEETNAIEEAMRYQALREYALGISGLRETNEPVQSRVPPLAINSVRGGVFGVCVPRVCTASQAVDFLMDRQNLVEVTYYEYFCRLPNDKLFSPADVVATVLFSILGFVIIISTSYDLSHIFIFKRDPKTASVLLRSFSAYTNTKRFLTFNSVPGALECVDGIRAISMMWVVVGHTYCFTLAGFLQNPRDALDWLSAFSSTWINSAPITVDTFFCLSGILVVYTTIGKISHGRFVRSVHLFYLNRLLRMFPILATVVLLQASLFNHFSDGPFWLSVSTQSRNCRKWWWSTLLHVQNYVNPTEICIPQSWYLSVDVQLYYFSPIILFWLFGRKRFAWLALVTVLSISLISSSVYSFMYDYSAGLFNPRRFSDLRSYMTNYYINTLARAPPFFVGMVYGYLLHVCRDRSVNISKLNVVLIWCLSFLMMAFCVFSVYPVMQEDHDAQIFDNFLNAYMRAIWACGLGWLIFACVHGYGGPINWFLTLSVWKLPARLSFAVYMVHVSVILTANGSWVKTHYFTEGDNMYRFFSDITITFIAAFILCIAIDAPFSTIQKLLLGGGARRPPKHVTDSQANIVNEGPIIIKTSF